MTTYKRTDYALITLKSLLANLRYAGGRVHVHIADDGSSTEHIATLLKAYEDSIFPRKKQTSSLPNWSREPTVTNSERGGYGKSYNLASQLAHNWSEHILAIEDDWELLRPLDVAPLIAALNERPEFGCIRLGYLGFTQELYGQFHHIAGSTYVELAPNSPEPHVFAGHPRLVTRDWERAVGPWPEGLAAGQTEFDVAHRYAARNGVLWPAELVRPSGDLFAHIGTNTLGELEPGHDA